MNLFLRAIGSVPLLLWGVVHAAPTPVIEVRVEPVLQARSGPSLRADGHRRFFTVTFHSSDPAFVGTLENPSPDGPDLLRVCRTDRFFVDFPFDAPGKPPKNLAAAISAALAAEATDHQRYAWWFDEGGRSPVSPPASACGYLPEATDRLSVQAGSLCSVITTLRRVAHDACDAGCGASATCRDLCDAVRVGRACTFTAMTIPGQAALPANRDIREWHLDRMSVGPGPEDNTPVTIALVDTGISADVGALPGVDVTSEGPDPHAGQPLRAHGTEMALLLRQMVPSLETRVVSYRVLDAFGEGSPVEVARALDDLVFGTPSSDPLVINLSLGWPPELSRERDLFGFGRDAVEPTSCATTEDGIGEPVRYVLDAARREELSGGRSVLVVGAAGNRGGDVVRTEAFAAAMGTDRATDASGLSAWFYPGQYMREPSARAGHLDTPEVALAVGAVDDQDRPSALSLVDAEPALVAPGQHVYVTHPGVCAAQPGLPACLEQPAPAGCVGTADYCPALTLPAAVTGTSVSAALVSGAAARAQQLWMGTGEPALSSGALTRLLYLSGEPVWQDEFDDLRRDPRGRPVRRLSVAGMELALGCEALMNTCIRDLPDEDPLGDMLLEDCASALADCGLEPGFEARPSRPARVAWGAPPTTMCLAAQGPSCGVTGLPPCGLLLEPDWYALGGLGPQPSAPGCPDCRVTVSRRWNGQTWVDELELVAQINPALTSGTQIVWADIVVTDVYGTRRRNLGPTTGWQPGQVLKMILPNEATSPAGATRLIYQDKSTTVTLELGIRSTSYGQHTVTDVSPLRLYISP